MVTPEDLAQAVGCSVAYVKRHAWIAAVVDFSREWVIPEVMQKGQRGRPRAVMAKYF
jgi:hypothetical protein